METTDQKPDDAPFVHTGMNRTPIRSDRTGRALSGERLRVRFFSVGIVRSSAPCCVYDRRCACAGACACACAGERLLRIANEHEEVFVHVSGDSQGVVDVEGRQRNDRYRSL